MRNWGEVLPNFDQIVCYETLKRVLDVSLGLALIIPVAVIVTPFLLLIVIEDSLPFFYRSKRVGLGSRIFIMFKLRSMYKVGNDERYATPKNDPRIMRIGKLIRSLSIDELPQIMNVILGNMSFIGPRPDDPRMKDLYTEKEWAKRHRTRPGITGLAQVINRHSLSVQQRKRLDLFYVEKKSLGLDTLIFFKTIKTLIFSRSF